MPTTTPVSEMQTGRKVYSPNAHAELTVVQLSYGHVDFAEVQRGTAKPIEARLSADGHYWESAWHTGESSGRECYVERHDSTGCVFHGWIDQATRKLVQAG